jgi:hypothetical protein
MSQIAHSQLALKKRATPVISDSSPMKGTDGKNTHTNGSNGHLNKSADKDVIIIDDQYEAIPVGREEIVVEEFSFSQEIAPMKKKRGRKPKQSTDSRESTSDISKDDISEESLKQAFAIADEIMPEPLPKDTKVVRLTADALSSVKNRKDRLQNASTIVNLSTVSTVSDQSTKTADDTIQSNTTTERRVSGRRSARIADTYRSPDLDDSLNTTTNATIGSEIADSILDTPATDRKRRFDSMENIDSPKRSRLDLSALFSNFTSPVSLLRNKFMRANLASTPKVDSDNMDDSASEMKEVDLNEKSEEVEKVNDEGEQENEEEELQVIEKPLKKRSCTIM